MNATPSLPPGPQGLRNVDFTFRFMSHPLESFVAIQREYGDVANLKVLNERFIIIADPALIDEVLVHRASLMTKDRVLRDLKAMFGEGLLTSEGDFWKGQRRLLAPAFTRKQVASYGDIMVRLTEDAIAEWTDGQPVDVHDVMMRVTLAIVTRTLFNSEVGSAVESVGRAVEETMLHVDRELNTWRSFLPRKLPTPDRMKFARTIADLDRIILGIIADRRAQGTDGNDLLSRMLAMRNDEGSGMTDRQIRDEALTLFLAGHETTALAMTWTLMLLSEHPWVETRLRQEVRAAVGDRSVTMDDLSKLPFAHAVIRESMRLYPPAWVIGREPVEDMVIGGHLVPRGTQVILPIWLMHRDPRWFVRPLNFEPQRWMDGLADRLPRSVYLPFGGGPRVCIGNHFAMMEAVLMLATLVRGWSFRVQAGYRPDLVPSITLRPRHGMPGVVRRA